MVNDRNMGKKSLDEGIPLRYKVLQKAGVLRLIYLEVIGAKDPYS
jgi:hypothetical protein